MTNINTEHGIYHLDKDTIHQYLIKSDNLFKPKLSTRVDLLEYADKLSRRAIHFYYLKNENIVGLCAMYANNFKEKIAFISHISVLKKFQRKGKGGELLKKALKYLKDERFEIVRLEVNSKNQEVIKFYEGFGFRIVLDQGNVLIMEHKINIL